MEEPGEQQRGLAVVGLDGIDARDLRDPKRLAERIEADEIDYPRPIVEHRAARIRAIEAFEAAKEA